jgi:hypothetical protein
MKGRYKQMELRLESLEKTLAEVEGAGRFVYSIIHDICYILTLSTQSISSTYTVDGGSSPERSRARRRLAADVGKRVGGIRR